MKLSVTIVVLAFLARANATVPLVNRRFCATGETGDGPYEKKVHFELCLDPTISGQGKVWMVDPNKQTSIWDGKDYTTMLFGDNQCAARPGDTNGFWGEYSGMLTVHPNATLLDVNGGNHTWAITTYKNWIAYNGTGHNCTGFNEGQRERSLWILSENMTNGTYDLLEQAHTLEDCDAHWVSMQDDSRKFTNITRDVNPGIFERPASYCYDPQHWTQSYQCTSTYHTPFGDEPVPGCSQHPPPSHPSPDQKKKTYAGCCMPPGVTSQWQCHEPANCTSLISGKAHP